MVEQKLNIAMLAPFGIRPKGTLLARMLPLAQALVQRGHQVHIFAPPIHNPQDAGRRGLLNGVHVIHTARPTLPGVAGVAQQVAALARPVLAFPFDLCHLFKPKGHSGLASLALRALRPRLPLVVDTDDWEGRGGWNDVLPYPRTAKALFAWQEHDLPRRADAVTVASRTLQTQVWGVGVPPARVFYLPNGISLTDKPVRASDESPTSARTILLYTRFWELDVREVVATLIAVHQQQLAARLMVVGKGERHEEDDLLQLAQRAGVAAAIDYRGWLEPAHLPAVFTEADVALVPMTDTLINRARCSAKLLELMAAGLPVVATHVGQNPEYIQHGVSGLLVPPGDPAALAQALLTLLNNTDLCQQFAAAGYRALIDYTWQRLAPTAEQAYRYALKR